MKFKLRPWNISDLNNLVKHANNWNIAKNMADKFPYPYTEAHGRVFIEFANKDTPIHIFAIDVNDEAIGSIGIHLREDIYRKNAELGYWLSEDFWNNGIISSAVQQIVNFAFETYDIERIFASVFYNNMASRKVLEKNRFVLETVFKETIIKNNMLIDECVYAFRRKDWKR